MNLLWSKPSMETSAHIKEIFPLSPVKDEKNKEIPDIVKFTGMGEIKKIIISPDEKILAILTVTGVYLYEGQSLRNIRAIRTDSVPRDVSFDYKAVLMATAHHDEARLWETSTGRLITVITGHEDYITSVSLSHDGKLLATGSADRTVKVWEVNSRKMPLTLIHTWRISSVKFSSESNYLVSLREDGWLRIWELWGQSITCERLRKIQYAISASYITFSPDGKILAFPGMKNEIVNIFDFQKKEEIYKLEHPLPVETVAFRSDGRVIACADRKGSVHLWDLLSGKKLSVLSGQKRKIAGMGFTSDGKKLILGGGSDGCSVSLWDIKKDEEIVFPGESYNKFSDFGLNPAAGIIVLGSSDGTLVFRDMKTFCDISLLKEHKREIKDITFSSDGRFLLTKDSEEMILWDFSGPNKVKTFNLKKESISYGEFRPDGRFIALGKTSGEHVIVFYDILNDKLSYGLRGPRFSGPMKFTSDGNVLISCAGRIYNDVILWDIFDFKRKIEYRRIKSPEGVLKLSPDGRFICRAYSRRVDPMEIGTGMEGAIWLWNIKENKLHSRVYTSGYGVEDTAFSPDGTLLASGNTDDTIRIWDTSNLKQIKVIKGHTGTVNKVSFSYDGKYLVSKSYDDTVRFWFIKIDLSEAAIKSVSSLEDLIDSGADINTRDERGRNLLYIAADNGRIELVQFLLAKGADPDSRTDYGDTPLFPAVFNGHFKIVKLLLDNGANVNTQTYCGETPLHWAVSVNNKEMTELLLSRGAGVDSKDKNKISMGVYSDSN